MTKENKSNKIVINAGYGDAVITRDGPSIVITVASHINSVYVASEADVDILFGLIELAVASGSLTTKDKVLKALDVPIIAKKNVFLNEKLNKII